MTTIIIENINLLNTCIECQASKREVRDYLKGVLFKEDRMTATEGHILASTPIDIPTLRDDGIIIPFPKPYPSTVERVVIDYDEECGSARVIAYKSNGSVQSDINVQTMDGAMFPQWQNLLDKDFEPATDHRQSFQPELLYKLTKHLASENVIPVVEFNAYGMHRIECSTLPEDSHLLLMGARL